MTSKLISRENLRRGIEVFQSHTHWNQDFHNSFYRDLHALNQSEITPTTWHQLVNYLWDWRAIRPSSKQQIYDVGLQHLQAINQILYSFNQPSQLTFEQATWDILEPLFTIGQAIKGVASPVFASKFCHFLRPHLYPVVDQAVLGIGNQKYATYWHLGHQNWLDCPHQTELVNLLHQTMGDEPFVDYPWATKIIELCTIGNRQIT